MAQNYDYGNIEGRREEKHKLKKWWDRLLLVVYLTISWALLFFFFINPEIDENPYKDVNLLNFVVIDWGNLTHNSLNAPLYFLVGGLTLFFFLAMFSFDGKMEIEDKIMELHSKKKKIPLSLKLKKKLVELIDPVVYYALYPMSAILIPIDGSSKIQKKKFYMQYGWLGNLEKMYFKRVVKRIDGYERVDQLSDFKDYPLLFSKEKSLSKAKIILRTVLKSRKDT